jgi:hypothetical protein
VNRTLCAVALFVLSLAPMAAAQSQSDAAQQAAIEAKQQFVGPVFDSTTTCSFNFSAGTGIKFIKYCVTANGNITSLESPSGSEYISKAPAGEGYGLCNFDTATAYNDFAGYGDTGWGPSSTVSSSATKVVIKRNSNDGIFTLTQTIALIKGTATITVTMDIKNNTGTARHIGILRYADIDAGGFANNNFDFTNRTAFGFNEQSTAGLQLKLVSGQNFNGSFSQNIAGPPNPCQIFLHAFPVTNGDGSVFSQFDIQLGPNATKKVAVAYQAF